MAEGGQQCKVRWVGDRGDEDEEDCGRPAVEGAVVGGGRGSTAGRAMTGVPVSVGGGRWTDRKRWYKRSNGSSDCGQRGGSKGQNG